jgi:hypothetical protein
MTRVLLIYPYFKPKRSRSIFRFPPLGICYVAASLQEAGYDVEVLDVRGVGWNNYRHFIGITRTWGKEQTSILYAPKENA